MDLLSNIVRSAADKYVTERQYIYPLCEEIHIALQYVAEELKKHE